MKNLLLLSLFTLIASKSAAAADCAALEKEIDALYNSPQAEQCDGSREGACAQFWAKIEALNDQLDEAGCPADEADDSSGSDQ